MRVAAVQCDICWEDRSASLARLHPMVEQAADAGAELIVLPEMFAVGFSMDTERVAEEEDGPTAAWLSEVARRRGVAVGGSIPTRLAAGVVHNRFVLATPDGAFSYDKVKPFSYSGEHERYQAGPGTVTWSVAGVQITPFLCYDLRFGDLWWERAADTEVYLCLASWPASRGRHWKHLLIARAIENQAWVVGCNRVGEGGGLDYAGDSVVIDPSGEVMAEASDAEEVLLAEIDPAFTHRLRAEFPFLPDR
ncbi:MAG TPA: nitrilase-related carbon-nitrogen hydrolase [Candidatus Acidoferrales bacterium]|nr:nitrilase-related carbon-nitrogen hydrolase [Candidatus Acidoferrales bacterium]